MKSSSFLPGREAFVSLEDLSDGGRRRSTLELIVERVQDGVAVGREMWCPRQDSLRYVAKWPIPIEDAVCDV